MNDDIKRCGRLGKHISHYWQAPKFYEPALDRWIKPVYFCGGNVVIEGGHHV